MSHRLVSMCQTVIDAFANNFAQIAAHCWRNIFAHYIATKGQRQASFALPPLSEINHLLKTGLHVGELSLVNDQTRVSTTAFDCVKNLIERHDNVIKLPEEKLQRQKRACHLTGHRDHALAQQVRIGR